MRSEWLRNDFISGVVACVHVTYGGASRFDGQNEHRGLAALIPAWSLTAGSLNTMTVEPQALASQALGPVVFSPLLLKWKLSVEWSFSTGVTAVRLKWKLSTTRSGGLFPTVLIHHFVLDNYEHCSRLSAKTVGESVRIINVAYQQQLKKLLQFKTGIAPLVYLFLFLFVWRVFHRVLLKDVLSMCILVSVNFSKE